jgi:hypothetical protein
MPGILPRPYYSSRRTRTSRDGTHGFLIACLQREVAARENHGAEGWIRAARFLARKSLEEFGFGK